jgi:hypothetical protein
MMPRAVTEAIRNLKPCIQPSHRERGGGQTARIALSALAVFVRGFLGRCPRLHMKAAPLALPSAVLTAWYEAVKAGPNGGFHWGKLRRSIGPMSAPFHQLFSLSMKILCHNSRITRAITCFR